MQQATVDDLAGTLACCLRKSTQVTISDSCLMLAVAAFPLFFLQVLEAMWDDSCSLVLTPQAFSNINPKADIFNNINQQFWEYVLPGCDALGYIACTGTNFCLRARSLAQVRHTPALCRCCNPLALAQQAPACVAPVQCNVQ